MVLLMVVLSNPLRLLVIHVKQTAIRWRQLWLLTARQTFRARQHRSRAAGPSLQISSLLILQTIFPQWRVSTELGGSLRQLKPRRSNNSITTMQAWAGSLCMPSTIVIVVNFLEARLDVKSKTILTIFPLDYRLVLLHLGPPYRLHRPLSQFRMGSNRPIPTLMQHQLFTVVMECSWWIWGWLRYRWATPWLLIIKCLHSQHRITSPLIMHMRSQPALQIARQELSSRDAFRTAKVWSLFFIQVLRWLFLDNARFINVKLEHLQGEIYSLCKDQHGCRYLQKKLEERNPEHVHLIFLETKQHVVELMTGIVS